MRSEPNLDAWVSNNNPPPEQEYGKGFWDYVEMLRRLMNKFEAINDRVIGTYTVHTPPPEEKLLMPALAFDLGPITIALKWDFGARSNWPHEWTVSIKRPSTRRERLYQLFDEKLKLSSRSVTGFPPDWVLPCYQKSPAAFTCQLRDEWDVATLVRIMLFER